MPIDNFPGQPPTAAITGKYPVTQYPQQAVVVGDVATTDASAASALNYLLVQQAELLTEMLIQMKIANYYLQSLTQIQDEPGDLACELSRGH